MDPRWFFMKMKKTVCGIMKMSEPAWKVLLCSLQMSCLLLLGSLVFFFRYEQDGSLGHLNTTYLLQDLSQLSLLIAALVPVCLEDYLRQSGKTPPDSSKR